MKKRNIELLAPAGSFAGFLGALKAGADAFYLAGDRFGARAYADNFTKEEMQEALFLAKLFERKVYLTVNTLMKKSEMDELYDFIYPLYKMGLHGVIVQDFGVFQFIKKQFPDLELHISTQMTVTSLEGAKFWIEEGAKRVVLSRELSLEEIKEITEAGIETECFIHGSMCYCYSGQCLFSSLLGGRSGNRGRCAQPCRQPYRFDKSKEEKYYLSLKDMCTLEHIPALIDSGITSFKIEGRMKNPAYSAWVTKMYRKYIDAYLLAPDKPFQVDKKDLQQLKTLYIRSELQDGYYKKHRGRDMITLESPAYSKTDDEFVAEITEEFIHQRLKKDVTMEGVFTVGAPCFLRISTTIKGKVYEACAMGCDVLEAIKAPLDKSTIKERLCKTGDSPFAVKEIMVHTDGNVFLPVKAINELRREALNALCESIKADLMRPEVIKIATIKEAIKKAIKKASSKTSYVCFVETKEQLEVLLQTLYVNEIVIPYGWILEGDILSLKERCCKNGKHLAIKLPEVCREKSYHRMETVLQRNRECKITDTVYVNQSDSLSYVLKHAPELNCRGDVNFYSMNPVAMEWVLTKTERYTVPVELNKEELKELSLEKAELIVYGRTPLMHTANCVFLTEGRCRKAEGAQVRMLKDRTGVDFPVKAHCMEEMCYNTIYNSVPTSLHKHGLIINTLGCGAFQLRFTTENEKETKHVLDVFESFGKGTKANDVNYSFTNGHFLRGIQ